MISLPALAAVVSLPAAVYGAIAQDFTPAAYSPTSASSNYVGANNGSLPKSNVTAGKVFDRFIQIWIENTDYQVAASTPEYQALAKEGIVLSSYYALTHVRFIDDIAPCLAPEQNLPCSPRSLTISLQCLETSGVQQMMTSMPSPKISPPLWM